MTSFPPELIEEIQNTEPCEFHGAENIEGEWVATLSFSYPEQQQVFIYRIKLNLLNDYNEVMKLNQQLADIGTPPKLLKDLCLAIQQTRQYCNLFN